MHGFNLRDQSVSFLSPSHLVTRQAHTSMHSHSRDYADMLRHLSHIAVHAMHSILLRAMPLLFHFMLNWLSICVTVRSMTGQGVAYVHSREDCKSDCGPGDNLTPTFHIATFDWLVIQGYLTHGTKNHTLRFTEIFEWRQFDRKTICPLKSIRN